MAKGSLSRRLLWLTFGVVLLVQVLFFLPSIARARMQWLEERIAYGQLAALSLVGTGEADGGNALGRPGDRAREDMLWLAGVESIRLLRPGGEPLTVSTVGHLEAAHVIDLRHEDSVTGLTEAIGDLVEGTDRLLLVQAAGPVGAGTVVSVVVRSVKLTEHLRDLARHVAVTGLLAAALTGLFVYLAMQIMIVSPIRRLTDSIVAFRADPERTPPLDTGSLAGLVADEVAVAGHELAAMQRELRAALWRYARLAALGTAVAKVSHDLRSILAPALLSAERLQSHADPNVRRIGDTVVRAVERATELVRGGLEFAREGPTVLVRRHIGLRAAVAEVVEQVQATLPALEVDNLVDPGFDVDADHEQLCRVLANLLRNAGEAGATRVTVDAVATAGATEIGIADDGPGLPPPVQTALFKPFVTGGRRGSTGLGLAIARDLMRAHVGDIHLVHTGSRGTRFRLVLPATLAVRAQPRSTAAAAE